MKSGKLYSQGDIRVVTDVFWKFPKCILSSSSLFSFSEEQSSEYYNPNCTSHSAPPVILTLGIAILWKSALFPLPGSYGKKLSWSCQECASPLPCGCAAFGETGVTKQHRRTSHNFPSEKVGMTGDKWITVLPLCFSELEDSLGGLGVVFFPASLVWECFRDAENLGQWDTGLQKTHAVEQMEISWDAGQLEIFISNWIKTFLTCLSCLALQRLQGSSAPGTQEDVDMEASTCLGFHPSSNPVLEPVRWILTNTDKGSEANQDYGYYTVRAEWGLAGFVA